MQTLLWLLARNGEYEHEEEAVRTEAVYAHVRTCVRTCIGDVSSLKGCNEHCQLKSRIPYIGAIVQHTRQTDSVSSMLPTFGKQQPPTLLYFDTHSDIGPNVGLVHVLFSYAPWAST